MLNPEDLTKPDLKALGIHDYGGLVLLAENQPPDLIEGLLPLQGIGILVGSPGIGKTPLVVSMGLSVASGLDVFGHKVERGPVLYCMGEGEIRQTTELIARLSRHLGLADPPSDFLTYSPYWGEQGPAGGGIRAILERTRVVRPKLLIIDTLRAFDPSAEKGTEFGGALCKSLRELNAEIGCASLIVHHTRKPSHEYAVSLEESPLAWFNEAAGTNALTTQPDSRLGVEAVARERADLLLGGFVRGRGAMPVHRIVRRFGADNLPVGYELISGVDRLSDRHRKAWEGLPGEFSYTDAKNAMGGSSDSSAADLLRTLKEAGLVVQPRPGGMYRKQTTKDT